MRNKLKIRSSIFETNSSSNHSFSMGPEGRFVSSNTLSISKSGVIRIQSDLWDGYTKTNLSEVKLSYLLSFAYTVLSHEKYSGVKKIVDKVVCDFTGARRLIYSPIDNIDHQSCDIIDRRDLYDPEFIKEFVFNPDTWLYIVWDSFDDIGTAGFLEKTDIDEPLYRLDYSFPGLDKDLSIVLSYREICSGNYAYRLSDLLRSVVFSVKEDKFVLLADDMETSYYECSDYLFYVRDFSSSSSSMATFSRYTIREKNGENEIKTVLPKITIL